MKAIPPTSVPLDCLFTSRAGASASPSPRALSSSRASRDSDAHAGQGLDHIPVFRELPERPPQGTTQVQDGLDPVRDVAVTVRIELGRARLRIADVLGL